MAWIIIPETKGLYSINDATMQVRNNKTGYIRKRPSGSISFSIDGKKSRGYTPQRVLYSVLHKIPLNQIPSDISFAVEDGKIAVYTRKDLIRKSIVRGNIKRRLKEGGYETIKVFIDAMIECKKNGDYGKIYEILYSYRDSLIDYTTRGHFVLTKDEARDYVDIVIEQTFDDIQKGSTVIFPFGYMVKSIKTLKKRMTEDVRQSKEKYKILCEDLMSKKEDQK